MINSDFTTVNGFAILKPGFSKFDINLENMLKDNDFIILNKITKQLSLEQAKNLYLSHIDKPFYNDLCNYMISGPITIYLCYTSANNPIEKMNKIKDSFRNNFAIDDMKNGMHSSDSLDNVEREKNICVYNC